MAERGKNKKQQNTKKQETKRRKFESIYDFGHRSLDQDIIEKLGALRSELLKEILEYEGEYLEEINGNSYKVTYKSKIPKDDSDWSGSFTDALMNFHNKNSIKFENMESISITNAQAKANGEKLIQVLMSEFGLQKFQAAAFAGVFMAESGLNPAAYNKEEKSGRGVPGQSKATAQKLAATCGYGAGLAQWTFQERKSKAVAALNKSRGTSYNWRVLEAIPLEDQVRMVGLELKAPFMQKVKASRSVEEAVDLVLRGYENGGGGSGALCSTAAIDKYTWCGGYKGAMKTRVGFAKSFL